MDFDKEDVNAFDIVEAIKEYKLNNNLNRYYKTQAREDVEKFSFNKEDFPIRAIVRAAFIKANPSKYKWDSDSIEPTTDQCRMLLKKLGFDPGRN